MSSDKYKSHEVQLKVPFHDLDPMQMVWHGNYLKYFDRARTALFDNAGIDLFGYFKKARILFPITKTSTKYIAPLQYRDIFTCRATVTEAQYKIVVEFQVRLTENHKLCARGRSEQVAVKHPEMEIMFEIPEEIRRALGF